MSTLVLATWAVTSTAALAAYDWTKIRADFEIGMKGKDYDDVDVTAGASKNFFEPYAEVTVKPFEESEFSVRTGYSYRQYKDKKDRNGNELESHTITKELYFGNDWQFGKFRLRPEIGVRKTDYAGYRYSSLSSNTEYRLYPKMDYKFNSNWMAYTRGFIGHYYLNKTGTSPTVSGDKWRLEGGARYTFNRNHAISVAYANERNEENRYAYRTDLNEIRLRYHWNPTRKLQIQPHVYLGFDGSRKRIGRTPNPNYGDGEYNKDRVGINGHYALNSSTTLLFQVHYEWYTDRTSYYSQSRAAVHKDNWFFNTGLKYSI